MPSTSAARYATILLFWLVPALFQPVACLADARQGGAIELAVKGSVRDGDSGLPISGARVTLTQAGNRRAFSGGTDAIGRFRILLAEPGVYFATATATGYVPPSHFQRAIAQVEVSAGAATPSVELMLHRPAVVTGRLVDESSEQPIRGLQIRAHAAAYREGRLALVPAGDTATAGDQGTFRIESLGPGEYLLEITPPVAETILPGRLPDYSDTNPRPTSYSRTLWPPGSSGQHLAPLILGPGQQVDLGKIPLPRRPTLRVRGSVGGGSCVPSAPVALVLMQRYGGISILRAQKRVPCGSEFTVANLAPQAEYQLAAFQVTETGAGPLPPAAVSVCTDVSLSTEDLELPLDLAVPYRIRGRIRFPTDFPPHAGLTVSLRPVRGYPLPGEGRPTAVDHSGRFELVIHARASDYELVVDQLGEAYCVEDLSYNGSKLSGMIFSPSFSALDHSLEVVISGNCAAVSGFVYSQDMPEAGARVVIAPWPLQLREGYPTYETSRTDKNGSFRKGGLRPGTYRVLAINESATRSLHRPYELIQLLNAAQEVELSEVTHRSLRLELLSLP